MPLSGACPACGWSAPVTDGVTDWAPASEAREAEREFYEGEYGAGVGERGEWMVPEALAWLWRNPYYPENERVLARVGDLRDRTVLLLGNGGSEKELFLLTAAPRALVVSDLAPAGLAALRAKTDPGRWAARLHWAAIDAFALPFPDRTIDVVYGYAFAHHLDDLGAFCTEVARVLAPGGRAVFFDDAYAPAWQGAKRTVLRPLMRWSHRRRPISEQDERFTLGGGFRTEELDRLIRAVGGTPFFERSGLVHYVWTRAWERLAPPGVARMATRPAVTSRLARLDRRLARRPRVRANLVRLVWGWDAPDGQA